MKEEKDNQKHQTRWESVWKVELYSGGEGDCPRGHESTPTHLYSLIRSCPALSDQNDQASETEKKNDIRDSLFFSSSFFSSPSPFTPSLASVLESFLEANGIEVISIALGDEEQVVIGGFVEGGGVPGQDPEVEELWVADESIPIVWGIPECEDDIIGRHEGRQAQVGDSQLSRLVWVPNISPPQEVPFLVRGRVEQHARVVDLEVVPLLRILHQRVFVLSAHTVSLDLGGGEEKKEKR